MMTSSRHKTLLALTMATVVVAATTNFSKCIEEIKAMPDTTTGGRDNRGRPIPIRNATAITYELCVQHCGSEPEPFSWTVFSQQFSAWLLPWLALISQLPFGANDKMDNLQSMLLSIGSPVLASYSLVLTALNGRWIARYFLPFQQHPNAYKAVRVLSSLQQAPLRINNNFSLLEALVDNRQNKKWWYELAEWLNMTHSWSISAASSIFWVFTAYIFTVVDSFTDSDGITQMVNANGQGVGSIWLWLLAIVVGWLQISPKCDSKHLGSAMSRANTLAWIPTPSGNRLAEKTDTEHAIYLCSRHSTSRSDEYRSPPIFNYARLFPWVKAVEDVAGAFRTATGSPRPTPSPSLLESHPLGSQPASELSGITDIPLQLQHRKEAKSESFVEVSVTANPVQHPIYIPEGRSRWGEGTWRRIFVSACLALFLQWGTTGAAVVVVWYTPTIGLGCRSSAYLLYGIISTLVWMAMLLSSILSHYSATSNFQRAFLPRLSSALSIFLRRLGKFAAACNGIGLVITCLFQFSNYFNRCYCNSSVTYWGSRAYDVISYEEEDIESMRKAWIGGVFLAAGSAMLFFIFVNLLINPSFPSQDSHED